MIGRNWTSKSAVVRLSCLLPVLAGMVLPAISRRFHWSIGITPSFVMLTLAIGWTGFVVWRTTMNAHQRGDYFGDIGP
jgi:hypothetical protein